MLMSLICTLYGLLIARRPTSSTDMRHTINFLLKFFSVPSMRQNPHVNTNLNNFFKHKSLESLDYLDHEKFVKKCKILYLIGANFSSFFCFFDQKCTIHITARRKKYIPITM